MTRDLSKVVGLLVALSVALALPARADAGSSTCIYQAADGRVGSTTAESLNAFIARGGFVIWKLCPENIVREAQPFALQSPTSPSDGVRWGLGLATDVGYIHSDSTITFSAGPRLVGRPPGGKLNFFGQFLVGGLHFAGFNGTGGGTDFMLMPGGGVLIAVPNHKFQIIGQVDFPIDFFSGGHTVFKAFSGGVVFPIG